MRMTPMLCFYRTLYNAILVDPDGMVECAVISCQNLRP